MASQHNLQMDSSPKQSESNLSEKEITEQNEKLKDIEEVTQKVNGEIFDNIDYKEIILQDILEAKLKTTEMVDATKDKLSLASLVNFCKKEKLDTNLAVQIVDESNAEENSTEIEEKPVSTRNSSQIETKPIITQSREQIEDESTDIVNGAQMLNGAQTEDEFLSTQSSAATITQLELFDTRVSAQQVIEKNIKDLKRKAEIDVQVIQLYDKSLANELQDHINRNVVGRGIRNLTQKTTVDFQATQENTDTMVIDTKLTIENFINTVKNISKNENNDNAEENVVWKKIKHKVFEDMQHTNEKTQVLSNKAKTMIHDNLNQFFVNPAGKKPSEEIEAEEFIKQGLLNIKEKVKEDLERGSITMSRTVEEAKDNVGLDMFYKKNTDESVQSTTGGFKIVGENLAKFRDKAKSDFNEIFEKVQEEVTTIKEQIDIPSENVKVNEEIPSILNSFPDTAQTDFKDTNVKIQENVQELKAKILQGVAVQENPQTSERQKELCAVVEKGLNEFQDMARSDFNNANEKIMDNVSTAKSKIDQSANKLKDKLFFKIP